MSANVHPRSAPNGSQMKFSIIGEKAIIDLRYGDKIVIQVNGRYVNAVVDVMVAAFWGGPSIAFRIYNNVRELFHFERKIVYQTEDGGWNEFRSLCPATEEEFVRWRGEFNGISAPTPMP